MLDEYIADGRIHILDDKYAYILAYFEENPDIIKNIDLPDIIKNIDLIDELKERFINLYVDYLLQTNMQLVRKVLHYNICGSHINFDKKVQFIFKPASDFDNLRNKASFVLKFERSENDHHYFNAPLITEWGGSACAIIDGEKRNIAEYLNEKEKEKKTNQTCSNEFLLS